MKRKVLIGMALLLVVPLLASCGGVAQDEYDAAVAAKDAAQAQVASLQSNLDTANAAKASLQSDLDAVESELATVDSDVAAAQSAKATAQSALAAAEAEIADLEAQIAELEAAVVEEEEEVAEEEEEEAVTGISFTAATYTNADYGFSVQYPDDWVEPGDLDEGVLFNAGSGGYFLPGLKIYTLDEADGATLEEAFATGLGDGGEIISFEASEVTINGTDFSKGVISYAAGDYAYDGEILGVIKDGKWIIFRVYTITSYFPFDPEGLPSEVLGTVTFE